MQFTVYAGGRPWACSRRWGGSIGSKLVALDWETTVDDLAREIPVGILATMCDGTQQAVVHPDQIPHLIREVDAAGASLVMQNAAFDLWVTEQALKDACADGAVTVLRRLVRRGRVWDIMILDRITLLALGDPVARNRPLDQIARIWLDPSWALNKNDPYRLRYGELLGVNLMSPAIDPGFFSYAMADSIATHAIAKVMLPAVDRLVSERRLPLTPAWGPLSHHLLLRASWALAQVTRHGIAVDTQRLEQWQQMTWDALEEALGRMEVQIPTLVKRWVKGPKDGSARAGDRKLSASGTPALSDNAIRAELVKICQTNDLPIPLTDNGSVSLSESCWEERRGVHPLIDAMLDFEGAAKIYTWTKQLTTHTESIHPRYDGPKTTGRTSAYKPSLQNTPKNNRFRHMFRARPGHAFVIADYSAIEMVTLASVLLTRFGRSVLGDVLRSGRDPHAYTAALVLGVDYAEFLNWKSSRPEEYGKNRQAAKAINFGVPGGLGPVNLQQYAWLNYGVDMTVEETAKLRNKLIREVYPELGEYLDEDQWEVLSSGLNRTVAEVQRCIGSDAWVPAVVRRIITGRGKRDGGSYDTDFEFNIWKSLYSLIKGRGYESELTRALGLRKVGFFATKDRLDQLSPGDDLEKLLFRRDAVLRTGRVRSYCYYTEHKNTPFQGLAADGATSAVYHLIDAGWKVVGFIHDEVIVEVPEKDGLVSRSDVDAIEKIMIESMAEIVGYGLPVKVETSASECWSKEAKFIPKGDFVEVWREG
jgi:hypothetical protein